jgi:hypothetical protein
MNHALYGFRQRHRIDADTEILHIIGIDARFFQVPGVDSAVFAAHGVYPNAIPGLGKYTPYPLIGFTDRISAMDQDKRTGLAAGVAAYLTWGFLPIFWKSLGIVPPDEILAWRVAGSAVVAWIYLAFRRKPLSKSGDASRSACPYRRRRHADRRKLGSVHLGCGVGTNP